MIAAFESLLPIFAIIVIGFALRARNIVPIEMWRGVEVLAYWVFFPALLSETLIRADLAALPLGAIAATMILSFLTMAGGLLLARQWLLTRLAINGPSFSSLFQNATRWNGFIALPILAKLYGDEGVALVALVMGALVPIANFAAVIVVAQNADGRRLTVGETIYVVFRNPFIWATAIGLIINLARIPIYGPAMTVLDMLGGAGIGAGLLMVGAGLIVAETMRPSAVVWLGTGLKLLATPLFVTLWSFVTGVSGIAFVACIVCASVPTAMSAYVLARQMGGDAALVAATVTLQTVVSFITIPLLIVFAQAFG
jgi:predicted permease